LIQLLAAFNSSYQHHRTSAIKVLLLKLNTSLDPVAWQPSAEAALLL